MSINTFGYDGRTYVYKAPVVDLWNATDASLKQLDNNSEFGKEFMKVVGGTVSELRARIRGANEPLSKANLVPLVDVLIAQLRRRVVMLDRASMGSEYTI